MYQRKKISARRGLIVFFSLALFILSPHAQVGAQEPKQGGTDQPAAKMKLEKGQLRVTASKRTPQTFTVRANEAELSDVTGKLSEILKVPFIISPAQQNRVVTLDSTGLTIEPILRLLSPKVYVDYELGGDMAQPKVLAVYLHGLNEPPPMQSAVVKSNTEAIFIEGDTEEGTEEYEKRKEKEEQYLKVTYSLNQLSVVARKQPLSVVLWKIASELGIPFDLRHESNELIDVDFKNYPLDLAVRNLTPAARLYYRADLQTSEIVPLRMSLVAPTPANPVGKS